MEKRKIRILSIIVLVIIMIAMSGCGTINTASNNNNNNSDQVMNDDTELEAEPATSDQEPDEEPTPEEPAEPQTEDVVKEVTAEIVDFAFMPKELEITKGTVITFINLDSVVHTATDEGGEFDSGSLAKNKEFSHAFQTEGEYKIYCKPHPAMKMTIIVK